jgi:hypothetical protein
MSMEEDSDEARTDEDDDGEEAMEMTQAVGGIHAAPPVAAAADAGPFSPSASTISAHSDEDDLAPRDDEDRTMDFTVATGGIIPPSAPPTADANVRRSLGYGVEEEEARRLNTWFAQQARPAGASSLSREEAAARAAAEEMEGYEEAEEDGMELTGAQGGILAAAGAPFDNSTDEVEMDLDDDDDGGMDYTTAAGGIFGGPSSAVDEDETEELDQDDDGGMDFTVAGGGISTPAAPAAAAGSSIFGPSSSTTTTTTTTSGRASLSAPPLRQSLSRSPAKSPRKSIASGSAPTPTRPIPSSLSRPTASSAAKAKAFTPSASTSSARNLFESPAKTQQPRSRASLAASPGGRKRLAEDDEDEVESAGAGNSLSSKSPAKRRASEAAPLVRGDIFGQPAPAPAAEDETPAESEPIAKEAPAAVPPAAATHSIFSPVKNAFSSIFSPARASPKGPPATATAGAKQSFPASLFASPLARAGSPAAIPAPDAPEVNIFSTSPQAAPPTSLRASFSGATANLFNPPPEEVEIGAEEIDMASAEAAADELFDEEVAQERGTTPPPAPARTREETATPSKKRLGRPSLAVGGAVTSTPRASQESADAGDDDEMVSGLRPTFDGPDASAR